MKVYGAKCNGRWALDPRGNRWITACRDEAALHGTPVLLGVIDRRAELADAMDQASDARSKWKWEHAVHGGAEWKATTDTGGKVYIETETDARDASNMLPELDDETVDRLLREVFVLHLEAKSRARQDHKRRIESETGGTFLWRTGGGLITSTGAGTLTATDLSDLDALYKEMDSYAE